MKRKYQIKNPCERHQLVSKGDNINYNCKSCNKNVKDLRSVEVADLITSINKVENTCVKILPKQLKEINQILQSSKQLVLCATALTLMTTSCNKNLIQSFGEDYGKVVLDNKSNRYQQISKNQIKGKVIDSYSKEPMQFAPIRILNNEFETLTDLEGNFNITIPQNIEQNSKLQFDYIGYNSLEIDISKIRGKQIIVTIGLGPTIGFIELIK